ncbi:hypothetical protein [Pelotomaculum propionicicum]|uniref:Uncharacterized protein n=1 Tax=Pelotomaculum propionicicum TaxID=258475 RepID=A0A4Y7RYF4_9FIRM|nr:hypothetical protein [Pelotomaculum propionicicum]TEB13347.1 hypothetical protein Pmgp_00241 [Pelotomaculum propionicicum]
MTIEEMKALLAKIADTAIKAQELDDIRRARQALNIIWVDAGESVRS